MFKRIVRGFETIGWVIGNTLFLKDGGGGVQPNHKQACVLAQRAAPDCEFQEDNGSGVRDRLFGPVYLVFHSLAYDTKYLVVAPTTSRKLAFERAESFAAEWESSRVDIGDGDGYSADFRELALWKDASGNQVIVEEWALN